MTGAPRIIALGVVIHSPELSPFHKRTPAHSLTWLPGFLADPLESPAARWPMDAGVVAGATALPCRVRVLGATVAA